MSSVVAASARKPGPHPRRAFEPAQPILRAGLVGARCRRGNPYLRRDVFRVSQRLAAGMSVAEVARAERTEESAVEALLAEDGFAELVESYKALAELPAEEQTARLVRLAWLAIENALADWDMGAAFFVLRENAQGRDPAATIAKRVAASARRTTAAAFPPAAPPPPVQAAPRSPRTYDPLDALVHRQTAALRRAVVAEHAVREAAAAPVAREATAPTGAAATMAAARKALALKSDACTPAASPITRLTRRVTAGTGTVALLPLDATPIPAPIGGLPRRPRAP
jgi:hypothetical protein